MKKIVAGAAGLAMAAALAACGGSTVPNEAAVNDGFANETVFNDELAIESEANVATLRNGDATAASFGNGADAVLTPTDNSL